MQLELYGFVSLAVKDVPKWAQKRIRAPFYVGFVQLGLPCRDKANRQCESVLA